MSDNYKYYKRNDQVSKIIKKYDPESINVVRNYLYVENMPDLVIEFIMGFWEELYVIRLMVRKMGEVDTQLYEDEKRFFNYWLTRPITIHWDVWTALRDELIMNRDLFVAFLLLNGFYPNKRNMKKDMQFWLDRMNNFHQNSLNYSAYVTDVVHYYYTSLSEKIQKYLKLKATRYFSADTNAGLPEIVRTYTKLDTLQKELRQANILLEVMANKTEEILKNRNNWLDIPPSKSKISANYRNRLEIFSEWNLRKRRIKKNDPIVIMFEDICGEWQNNSEIYRIKLEEYQMEQKNSKSFKIITKCIQNIKNLEDDWSKDPELFEQLFSKNIAKNY